MKNNISIQEMLETSIKQHDLYKASWKPLIPDSSKDKLLWLTGELGEVIDLVKKKQPLDLTSPGELRDDFIKEVVDCYMYLADLLNCYNVSPKEFSDTYFKKVTFNIKNPRKYWITEKQGS